MSDLLIRILPSDEGQKTSYVTASKGTVLKLWPLGMLISTALTLACWLGPLANHRLLNILCLCLLLFFFWGGGGDNFRPSKRRTPSAHPRVLICFLLQFHLAVGELTGGDVEEAMDRHCCPRRDV